MMDILTIGSWITIQVVRIVYLFCLIGVTFYNIGCIEKASRFEHYNTILPILAVPWLWSNISVGLVCLLICAIAFLIRDTSSWEYIYTEGSWTVKRDDNKERYWNIFCRVGCLLQSIVGVHFVLSLKKQQLLIAIFCFLVYVIVIVYRSLRVGRRDNAETRGESESQHLYSFHPIFIVPLPPKIYPINIVPSLNSVRKSFKPPILPVNILGTTIYIPMILSPFPLIQKVRLLFHHLLLNHLTVIMETIKVGWREYDVIIGATIVSSLIVTYCVLRTLESIYKAIFKFVKNILGCIYPRCHGSTSEIEIAILGATVSAHHNTNGNSTLSSSSRDSSNNNSSAVPIISTTTTHRSWQAKIGENVNHGGTQTIESIRIGENIFEYQATGGRDVIFNTNITQVVSRN